ncbi:MAG: sodium:solute symporter, partial [Acidobacteriota bacterium]|nr:sodium:solute symporter [Acidobacteriota bacterium]
MGALDLSIVVAYLAGTLWLGFALSGGQSTVHDYFTSRRRAPWGLVMASIVATETSTVTIVSLPGFAFGEGLTFLQLVLGYLVGRAFVVWLLLPSYFRGEYLTAYQVLS